MIKRLSTALCSPSKIGLMFKDKFRTPLILILSFFFIIVGIGAIKFYNTDYLEMSDVQYVTSSLLKQDNNIYFDNNGQKLSGNSVLIDNDTFDIYFMRDTTNVDFKEYILDFTENYVTFYVLGQEVKTINYKDLDIKFSFNLEECKKNNVSEKIKVETFINTVFDEINIDISTTEYLTFIGRIIIYYLVVLLINFISTCFFNPTIERKIRLKLLMYSTLVYFLFALFYVLFSSEWLIYAALIIPMFYSTNTFAHIRKVK